jgi:hypothetical protein
VLQRNIIHANHAAEGGGMPVGILPHQQCGREPFLGAAGASGLHVEGANPHLSHNTIARNTGGDGSLYVVDRGPPTVFITNTVLVNQRGDIGQWVNTVTVMAS